MDLDDGYAELTPHIHCILVILFMGLQGDIPVSLERPLYGYLISASSNEARKLVTEFESPVCDAKPICLSA
jgi:hypothetical protein